MRPRALAAALVAAVAVASAVLGAVAFAGGSSAKGSRLTVFAAASLTDVFAQLDPHERYSFGGSNMLAAQIRQGLPADVFASANTKLVRQLHEQGLLTRPVVFTANRLVVVVADGNPLHLRGVRDVARRRGLRIVMAAPGVPVGDYTRTVLARLGLSGLVGKAVSQETDVREVLAKVVLGEADAGFVYATDAETVAGKVSVLRLPLGSQPRVLYAAAAVKDSRHPTAAKAWVERLRNGRAQEKLRAAGFLPLPH